MLATRDLMVEIKKQDIAIVVPCFCEAGNVAQFYKVLTATVESITDYNWKILFVDDGSQDNTAGVMQKIVE